MIRQYSRHLLSSTPRELSDRSMKSTKKWCGTNDAIRIKYGKLDSWNKEALFEGLTKLSRDKKDNAERAKYRSVAIQCRLPPTWEPLFITISMISILIFDRPISLTPFYEDLFVIE